MRRPSGDQAGDAAPTPRVSRRSWRPSASMTTSSARPARPRTKASRRPSGDHAGDSSSALPRVRRRGSCPGPSRIQRSCPRCRLGRTKAIWPRADQAGAWSSGPRKLSWRWLRPSEPTENRCRCPRRAPLEGDLVPGRRPRRVALGEGGLGHPAQDGAVEVHRPDRPVAGEGQAPAGGREGRVAHVAAGDEPLQAPAARAAGEEDAAGARRRLVGDDAVAPREGGVGRGRGGQAGQDGRGGEQEGEQGAGHCRTATPPGRRGCARRADPAPVV